MDYKKKYEDALKRAKDVHTYYCDDRVQLKKIESIFPELTESKNEKIRKAIHIYLDWLDGRNKDYQPKGDYSIRDMIAWLEKQGKEECALKSFKDEDVRKFMQYIEKEAKAYEFNLPNRSYDIYAFAKDILVWLEKQGDQKPIDNVESKFKVGDWVSNKLGESWHIDSIDTKNYQVSDGKGNYNWFPISKQDEMNLWTIANAKPGDVLVSKHNQPFIYNGIFDEESVGAYCGIDKFGDEFLIDTFSCDWSYKEGVKPATKEQHDILFTKMREAEWEWNAEKKELRKIEEEYDGEDYGINSLFHAKRILEKTLGKVDGYQTDDGMLEHKCAISAVKKLYGQKPAEWSEEDEHRVKDIIYFLDAAKKHYASTVELDACIDWLKSLKERIGE